MEQNRCRDCKYSCEVDVGLDGEMLRACLYILRRGERRPCPAGDGCTVFEPRAGGREGSHDRG